MNAPAAKLEAVLALLPSLNSPTVAPLQNGEWLSLETVVSTGIVRDLIPSYAKPEPREFWNSR